MKLRWNEGKDHGTELTRAMAMVRSPAWAKNQAGAGARGGAKRGWRPWRGSVRVCATIARDHGGRGQL